jgi:putative ABC transport system permease protein
MTKHYRRLFRLRFTRASQREVDDEFAFHFAMRAQELEARGLDPEDARTETLRQFGDINDARAFCRAEDNRRMREYRWALLLDNLRQDVALSIRAMRRQPAFTMSTVLTLGVAIGIAASAYGVINAYLIRPLPYPDADRLVHVIAGPSRRVLPNAPNLSQVDWTLADTVFAETVRWDLDGFTLAGGERPEFVDGAWVSAGYFNALGMRTVLGRSFTPDEYGTISPVAIISDALWSRYFGRDPSIIGKTVRAHSVDRPNDEESVTIVGVMPADAWHVSRFTDFLRPLATGRNISMAKLKPGQTIAQAEAQLNAVVISQLGNVDPAWHMTLVSAQDEYTYQFRPTLIALFGAAIFLLLVGGASVGAAHTARAAARQAELQLRTALGASTSRITSQLLVESLTIATTAALLGALLSSLALASIGAVIGDQLGAGIPGGADRLRPSLVMLAGIVGLGALVGAAFGLIPALSAVRRSRVGVLGARRGSASSAASPILRRGLIVAQIAITMMLLVGAGLMARSILAIGAEPLGFAVDRVVKGNMLFPMARYADESSRRLGMDRLMTGLHATPGIEAAAASSPYPFRGVALPVPVTAEGQPALGAAGPRAVTYVVTEKYFEVFRIPLRGGRVFGPQDDASSTASVVISERLARTLWPDEDALGRRLMVGDSVLRSVVGVVGDIREPVESEQSPDLYYPYSQVPRRFMSVVARGTDDQAGVGTIVRQATARVDDLLALSEVEPMTEVVSRNSRRHRALTAVLSSFGGLALGIAMLGVYASLAYVVAQRRREIAVRVAVGADSGRIRRLVLGEASGLVLGGVLSGTVLSLLLTRVIATQLYGVGSTDPVTFVAMAGLLGIAALAAAAAPIRNALRVQPAEILRSE